MAFCKLTTTTVMRKLFFLLALLSFNSPKIFGQGKTLEKISQLTQDLATAKSDTERYRLTLAISKCYQYTNTDSSIRYATEATNIADVLADSVGKADALMSLGLGHKLHGHYAIALTKYVQAIRIYRKAGNIMGVGRAYNSFGNIYNIQKDYPLALKSFFASLDIKRQQKDTVGMASTMGNLGLTYFNMGKYQDAEEYFKAVRKMLSSKREPQLYAVSTDNLGDVMVEYKQYSKAKQLYQEALQLRLKVDEPIRVAGSYNSLGRLYKATGNYRLSIANSLKCYHIAHATGSLKLIKECTNTLSAAYESLGSYKEAKKYFEEYIVARDSMYHSEGQEKLLEQKLLFQYELNDALRKAEQAKRDAVTNEQLKQAKAERLALICGLILVLIIALLAIWAFRQKRRDNEVITKLANEQEMVIEERTAALAKSNGQLKDLNGKLLQVIHYNAHQLREPLTRIMGIMSVAELLTEEELENYAWPGLRQASDDLDRSIREAIAAAEGNQPAK
jgi:tetratricopeptide (TPR) repeat protein